MDLVTLWRAVGRGELERVAAAGWRAWPAGEPVGELRASLSRAVATTEARQRHVPADGAGFVTTFDVPRRFLERYPAVGGQYTIPSGDVAALNDQLSGAIVEMADYRGPVPEEELDPALPAAWRDYLAGPSWLRRGWLDSGCYLWLYPPAEGAELLDAWGEPSIAAHPGIAIIGGDGGREHLALDLRADPVPVMMVEITSGGWEGSVRQAPDVASFLARVEAGTFDFTWLP
ncbi:hypothetical protein [Phytohabitans aurantiacus]|uniref:Knr4/Smi1-like domain-containing protein n=1 Tax=Phytohabitans aurantiacus TaxID=3016789 RepID=A0ABQ5QZY5_9ACTN|nr:hypothetical protein [Phytohabitans aurantiacus]GLH99186.1 hypothetical protein Pa4123_44610 [Phytohabitans aurantiacus]